jgi:hypothetical protein
MRVLSQKNHEPVTAELLNLRCIGVDYHPFARFGRAGTLKLFLPLNLHCAKLTAIIHKVRFPVLKALAITVDSFCWL